MLTSGFFNSVNGDRTYDAEQISSIFDGIVDDGVYKDYEEGFSVSPGSGSSVIVGAGRARFNHFWVLNDSARNVALDAAEALLNRYDVVYFDVNRGVSVRSVDIRSMSGVASSSPTKPTLPSSVDQHCYPIAYIFRPAGSTSISQSNIEYMVGTASCPYAKSVITSVAWPSISEKPNTLGGYGINDAKIQSNKITLGGNTATIPTQTSQLTNNSGFLTGSTVIEAMCVANPSLRKTIYRGQHLGTTLTSAQKTAIANGTFDNMYLGDYWTDPQDYDRKWYIVDFDYWFGFGANDDFVSKHHINVMPAGTLFQCVYSSTSSTTNRVAYADSPIRTAYLDQAKTSHAAHIFGSSNFLTRKALLVFYIYGEQYAGSSYYDVTGELPDAAMMYGFLPAGLSTTVPHTDSHGQLSLFKIKPEYIAYYVSSAMWLRDGDSSGLGYRALAMRRGGHISNWVMTDKCGLRPLFSVVGN